jgi:hypothetical protein
MSAAWASSLLRRRWPRYVRRLNRWSSPTLHVRRFRPQSTSSTYTSSRGSSSNAVVVVDPEAILAQRPDGGVGALYTALTRSTRALAILHIDELPGILSRAGGLQSLDGTEPETQWASLHREVAPIPGHSKRIVGVGVGVKTAGKIFVLDGFAFELATMGPQPMTASSCSRSLPTAASDT